jgi:hypothetical protein
MKKNFKVKSKNRKVLENFIDYCIKHPDERFWQALRNWSEYRYIFASNDTVTYMPKIIDTFYFEGKDK